jgi:hypothetical protein
MTWENILKEDMSLDPKRAEFSRESAKVLGNFRAKDTKEDSWKKVLEGKNKSGNIKMTKFLKLIGLEQTPQNITKLMTGKADELSDGLFHIDTNKISQEELEKILDKANFPKEMIENKWYGLAFDGELPHGQLTMEISNMEREPEGEIFVHNAYYWPNYYPNMSDSEFEEMSKEIKQLLDFMPFDTGRGESKQDIMKVIDMVDSLSESSINLNAKGLNAIFPNRGE